MSYKIGFCYGDAIDPEVAKATEAMRKAGLDIEWPVFPMGWEAIKEYSNPVPQVTIDGLRQCDAWVFAPRDSAYPKGHFERANPSAPCVMCATLQRPPGQGLSRNQGGKGEGGPRVRHHGVP